MKRASLHLFSLLTALAAVPCSADILSIEIAGRVRDSADVKEFGTADFTVTDLQGRPTATADVELINAKTQKVVSTKAVRGTARFEKLEPGKWVWNAPAYNYSAVAITDYSALAAASALAPGVAKVVGASALVAGTGVVVANEVDDSNSGTRGVLSQSE